MNTYIHGFTFSIEKRKVFIEATALNRTGVSAGLGLLCIEVPTLRSVATCNDLGAALREFEKMGIRSPSPGDMRGLRAAKTYECRFWMHDSRQWKQARLRPQFEGCLRSAKDDDAVVLVDAADVKPSFRSVPLSEGLILALCGQAYSDEADIIYVAEGLRAPLFKADDYLGAFDEILRLRRDGLISKLFPRKEGREELLH